jgi:hypothetical protein
MKRVRPEVDANSTYRWKVRSFKSLDSQQNPAVFPYRGDNRSTGMLRSVRAW